MLFLWSFRFIVAINCLQFLYFVIYFRIRIEGWWVRGFIGFLDSNYRFVSFFLCDNCLIWNVENSRVSAIWRYGGVLSSLMMSISLRNYFILSFVLQSKIKSIVLLLRNRFWFHSRLTLDRESRVIGLLLLIWAWCWRGLRSLLGLLWHGLLLILTLGRLCCNLSCLGSAICCVWWVWIILVRKSIHIRMVSWNSAIWQIRCIFGLLFKSTECNHIK
jgi:hypothetical protein